MKIVRGAGYGGIVAQANMVKVPEGNAFRSALTDLVISNTYFSPPWKSNDGLWTEDICPQKSSLEECMSYWASSASVKLNDRPFGITEYNHCYWNKYRYEGFAFAAYSAFQNFSYITLHANAVAIGENKGTAQMSAFETRVAPITRANELLSSAFFVRGDVLPSRKRVDIVYEKSYVENSDDARKGFNLEQSKIALMTGFACGVPFGVKPESARRAKIPEADVSIPPTGSSKLESSAWFQEVKSDGTGGFDLAKFAAELRSKNVLAKENATDPSRGIFQTDTGQITLDAKSKSLKVATDFSAAAALEKSENVKLGAFEIKSVSVSAGVGIASLDGKKLGESEHLILAFSTREANRKSLLSADGTIRLLLGEKGPILLRKGSLSATLKLQGAAKKYFLYPLALNGVRREKIALEVSDGFLKIDIENFGRQHGATNFFEIVAER